jgi:hypothetical protein
MNGQRLTGLGSPSGSSDAVNLSFVQALIQSWTWKDAAKVVATTNISIAAAPLAIDGYDPSVNDRILLIGQTNPAENGLYSYEGSGVPMTRTIDANNSAEMQAMVVPVNGGSNADTMWILTTPLPFTLGVTPLTFTNLPMAGATASNLGDGSPFYAGNTGSTLNFRSLVAGSGKLSLTTQANDILIDLDPANIDISTLGLGNLTVGQGGTGSTTAGGARANLGVPGKYSTPFGDGTTTLYTIVHNLNTMAIVADVFEASTGERVFPDIFIVDANTVSVSYYQGLQPTLDAHIITIMG